jgi:hypothetical protein
LRRKLLPRHLKGYPQNKNVAMLAQPGELTNALHGDRNTKFISTITVHLLGSRGELRSSAKDQETEITLCSPH